MKVCGNEYCLASSKRLILLKAIGIYVCDACYLWYRNHKEVRKPRKCLGCASNLTMNSKNEFCSDCCESLDFSYEFGGNPRVRWQPSGLCSGHITMLRRDGSLKPLGEGITRREHHELCPLHSEKQYKTPRGHYRCSSCNRESRWKREYGVKPDSIIKMFEEQLGKCSLEACDRVISLKESSSYHIDHCHATGQIRGILCPLHNQMLGMAADSTEILKSAIKYLEKNVYNLKK